MLFNSRDADFELLAFVDFIFLKLGQLDIDAIDFCAERINAQVEPRNVLLRRHVLDDVREHFPDFFEGRLLRRHMQQVYHTAQNPCPKQRWSSVFRIIVAGFPAGPTRDSVQRSSWRVALLFADSQCSTRDLFQPLIGLIGLAYLLRRNVDKSLNPII
jgi:hypothetical protein